MSDNFPLFHLFVDMVDKGIAFESLVSEIASLNGLVLKFLELLIIVMTIVDSDDLCTKQTTKTLSQRLQTKQLLTKRPNKDNCTSNDR